MSYDGIDDASDSITDLDEYCDDIDDLDTISANESD